MCLIKILLSTLRCEAEMMEETFLIVIEASCKDKLKVFELAGGIEGRH